MKESKRTHRFSVTLSFAPKRSSVLSDERFGAKFRVTENRCVLFDSFTYIYTSLLPQHRALYAKVDSTLIYIYTYTHAHIYIYTYTYRHIYTRLIIIKCTAPTCTVNIYI